MSRKFLLALVPGLLLTVQAAPPQSDLTWQHMQALTAPEMAGRANGSEGAKKARIYIRQQYQRLALRSFGDSYIQAFRHKHFIGATVGVNVLGWHKGKHSPEDFIVVTAHYDHLGRYAGRIHPGADDNASGVAALLTLAERMGRVEPCHSIAFVATDAEEKGLYGAKAFLHQGPVAKEHIKANLNLDMLGHSGRREVVYMGGPRHYPQLAATKRRVLERFAGFVREGRDGRGFNYNRSRRIDYRNASDHAVFDRAGIPFIFLNGADHRYYHTPQDTLSRIDQEYFFRAVEVAAVTLVSLDQTLSECAPALKES